MLRQYRGQLQRHRSTLPPRPGDPPKAEIDACIEEAKSRPLRSSLRLLYTEYAFRVTGAHGLLYLLERERVHAEIALRRQEAAREAADAGGSAGAAVSQGLHELRTAFTELQGPADGSRVALAKKSIVALLRDRGRVIADSFKQFRLGYREVVAAADPVEEQREAEALAAAIREKDVERITGAVAKAATDIIGEDAKKEIGKAMKVVGDSAEKLATRAREREDEIADRRKK
jgi:hypothetical protein